MAPGVSSTRMSESTVRIAAIQATPVILDAEATVEKACGLIGEAAADGAQLAVLPEAFIPLYPSNAWAKGAAGFAGWDALWERLWENSVDVPGPITERLGEACREHGIHCAIGVNERESERPGSLYNTLLVLGPEGLLHKHRKLMPTMHERLFHGIGAGDDLDVIATRSRADRWLDLLGEPDAAGALRRLPRRAPGVGRTDRRRLRGLAGEHAAYRDRGGRVRGLGAAVHSRFGFPRGLPGAAARGQGGVRQRRRGDRRAAAPARSSPAPCTERRGSSSRTAISGRAWLAKRSFDAVGHYSREDVFARTPAVPGAERWNGEQTSPGEAAPTQDAP